MVQQTNKLIIFNKHFATNGGTFNSITKKILNEKFRNNCEKIKVVHPALNEKLQQMNELLRVTANRSAQNETHIKNE